MLRKWVFIIRGNLQLHVHVLGQTEIARLRDVGVWFGSPHNGPSTAV